MGTAEIDGRTSVDGRALLLIADLLQPARRAPATSR
jgi:hypothetical protein